MIRKNYEKCRYCGEKIGENVPTGIVLGNTVREFKPYENCVWVFKGFEGQHICNGCIDKAKKTDTKKLKRLNHRPR